jgi:hypothetical protein
VKEKSFWKRTGSDKGRHPVPDPLVELCTSWNWIETHIRRNLYYDVTNILRLL